jgi:RHS repeat-associated protein
MTSAAVCVSKLRFSRSRFTGKERDAESGLDYFGARYYASSMGRFMSPDPSGLAYANPMNPQSFNFYTYALNNPLRFVDPSGLTICDWGSSDQGGEDYDDDADCAADGGTVVTDNQTVTVNSSGNSGDYLETLDDGGISTLIQYIPGQAPNNCVPGIPCHQPGRNSNPVPIKGVSICGGGVFGVAGREISGAVVHGAVGVITEVDSRSGVSSGALVEAGVGDGYVGGGGAIRGTAGVEGFGYAGVNGDIGVAGGSAGIVGFSSGGAGVYIDGQFAGRMIGGGAYVNLVSGSSCPVHP